MTNTIIGTAFLVLFFFFAVCGISIPKPGIEPGPLVVKAQIPDYWTTREFLGPGFEMNMCTSLVV